jgi:hypothetical protein
VLVARALRGRRFLVLEEGAVRAATSSVFERAGHDHDRRAGPYQLDPSIMMSGTGPSTRFRRIARVETITEGTWKGATSAEVTAAYQAEARR